MSQPPGRPTVRRQLLLLPLASCGFALAQPLYQLLLCTPMFLLARQNTPQDVWGLTFFRGGGSAFIVSASRLAA